jgi:hypothetical protein
MATRCDCSWVPVSLHPDLETVLLRVDDVAGCPAHTTTRSADQAAGRRARPAA